ncbi:MAG: ATP-binding protein [Methanosarcinales archaeon]
MQKDEILKILVDWNFWEQDLETGIPRNLYLKEMDNLMSTDQVITLIGPRRSGKSTLLLQFAKFLVQDKKVEKRDILIVNFEDYRFTEFSLESVHKIYETYLEKVKPNLKTKPYIFLDEVQRVKEWERFVRSLHERKEAKFIVTGSASKLLGELGTLLTGRHLSLFVFPLSFREFLEFKGLEIKDELDLAAKRIEIKKLFSEYFELGGFPEVVLKSEKTKILLEYFNDIISRDVVERFRVREILKLKTLAKYYITNFSNPITFNSIKRLLNIPLHTVERFSYYLENSGLIYFLSRFSPSLKMQEKSPRKVYVIDNGLVNAIGLRVSSNFGRLAENLVFIELKRRYSNNPLIEIFYWKSNTKEVDFVIKKSMRIECIIQVCWNIEDEKTKKREIDGLLLAMKKFKLNEGLVITEDYEGEDMINDKTIKFRSLWKWLLNKNKSTMWK